MDQKQQAEADTLEHKKYLADLDKTISESMKVSMEPTTHWIRSVERNSAFTISSKYKSIDGATLQLKRSKHGYRFVCPSVTPVADEVKVNELGYWFFEEHAWKNANLCLDLAKHGIAKLTMTDWKSFSFDGPVREFSQSYPQGSGYFRRFVIRVADDQTNRHYRALSSTRFAYGGSLRTGGMCVFQCQDVKMRLFDFKGKGFPPSIIIDANRRLDHETFQRMVKATLTVLGVVTGDLHRGEQYTIASTDNEHSNPVGLHYYQGRDSVLTELAWLDGDLWGQVIKKDHHLAYLPMDVFSTMITKAHSDAQYARALWIIAESNAYPFEIRASAYSVALETMKNIISQEKPEAFSPFKSKGVSRDFRKACTAELHKLPDDAFNNKDAVLKRIEQLNQPTNSDALETSFRVAGVRLNDHDKRTISTRNDFLHGRIPFENEPPDEEGDTLYMIGYKLQFLLAALTLRYAGYQGGIRNNYVYAGAKAGRNTGDDALFR